MRSLVCFALVGGLTLGAMPAKAKEMMEQSERVKGRSYSEAVITEGGRIVWLAGESTITDLDGKDIKNDVDAQSRTIFALIDRTLHRAGGSLKDVVSMTVYLTDLRNGAAFQKVRTETFPDRDFPASAQIAIRSLVVPGSVIEIQAIAVIGDKCSKATPCLTH